MNDRVKNFEIMFGQRKGYKGEIKNNYCEWGGEDGGEPNGKGADFSNKKTIESGTAPEKDRCVRGGPDMKNECEVNGMKRWNVHS